MDIWSLLTTTPWSMQKHAPGFLGHASCGFSKYSSIFRVPHGWHFSKFDEQSTEYQLIHINNCEFNYGWGPRENSATIPIGIQLMHISICFSLRFVEKLWFQWHRWDKHLGSLFTDWGWCGPWVGGPEGGEGAVGMGMTIMHRCWCIKGWWSTDVSVCI